MSADLVIVTNVSSLYFSVARHYGGARINGRVYVYFPERDILVREDWIKSYRSLPWNAFIAAAKAGEIPEYPKRSAGISKKEELNNQPSLFD